MSQYRECSKCGNVWATRRVHKKVSADPLPFPEKENKGMMVWMSSTIGGLSCPKCRGSSFKTWEENDGVLMIWNEKK